MLSCFTKGGLLLIFLVVELTRHNHQRQVMEELLRNGAKVGARTQLREDTSGTPSLTSGNDWKHNPNPQQACFRSPEGNEHE